MFQLEVEVKFHEFWWGEYGEIQLLDPALTSNPALILITPGTAAWEAKVDLRVVLLGIQQHWVVPSGYVKIAIENDHL